MPALKAALIGAGSAFAFSVIADFTSRPALAGSTIALVDTDASALDLSTRIARRMVAETGADLRIEETTDRRQALPGSDFVLNSISVGEPWARERDVAMPSGSPIFSPPPPTVVLTMASASATPPRSSGQLAGPSAVLSLMAHFQSPLCYNPPVRALLPL